MTNPTATLPAGVMKRLAEDMGWMQTSRAPHWYWCFDDEGRLDAVAGKQSGDDTWTLTPAGCWLVSGHFGMDITKTGSGTWDAVIWNHAGRAGDSVNPVREVALHEAVADMYGEGDE